MTWERRWHPLRREWVTITSHRNARPWSGAASGTSKPSPPAYLPDCYLCPGNSRVSGANNENYESLFFFDNDHPSFSSTAPSALSVPAGIYQNAPANGITRVGCYTPDHSVSFARLSTNGFEQVLAAWAEESSNLAAREDVDHVLIFENKGEVIGVSNPHPHCQVYGAPFVFKNIELELDAKTHWLAARGTHLFEDIIASEEADGRRLIESTASSIAFLPYFSRFPFESYIAPRTRHAYLQDLSEAEQCDLAETLRRVLVRYDNLWQTDFPYMLVLHQAPCDGGEYGNYHFHIQVHPLMRQPGLQKFLAGVESGAGNFLNDVDPEAAASALRALPVIHHRDET